MRRISSGRAPARTAVALLSGALAFGFLGGAAGAAEAPSDGARVDHGIVDSLDTPGSLTSTPRTVGVADLLGLLRPNWTPQESAATERTSGGPSGDREFIDGPHGDREFRANPPGDREFSTRGAQGDREF